MVLAGGWGRRMQTARFVNPDAAAPTPTEKGLVCLYGRPLITWALQGLPAQRRHTYISANRCHHDYARYGQVVPDDPALGVSVGPLQGVASVLQICSTPWLMVVPVDVPAVPHRLFEQLAEGIAGAGHARLAYARTDVRSQPLFMLVHVTLLPALRQYLSDGGRRVHAWIKAHGVAVSFSDRPPAFFNINTPADLREAARQLRQSDRL